MDRWPRWIKRPKYEVIPWIGIHDFSEGASFNPFNTNFILGRIGLFLAVFLGIPVLAGLAIVVLQSVFPWWPR